MASRGQLLWRVEATETAQAAPEYEKSQTPFPMKPAPEEKPKMEVKKKRPSKNALAELERQRRARMASQLMEKIQTVMSEDTVIRADVSTVRLDGRILSEYGYRILVNDSWIGQGDVIVVPAVAHEGIWSLINELEELDSELGAEIVAQLETRVNSTQDMDLTVKEITKNQVVLESKEGVRYPLSLELER